MARSSVSHLDTFEKDLGDWRAERNSNVRIVGMSAKVDTRSDGGIIDDFETDARGGWISASVDFSGGSIVVEVNGQDVTYHWGGHGFQVAYIPLQSLRSARQNHLRLVIRRRTPGTVFLRNFYLLQRPMPGETHHFLDSRRRSNPPRFMNLVEEGTTIRSLTRVDGHLESIIWYGDPGIRPESILHRDWESENIDHNIVIFHPVEIIDAT